MGLDNFLTEKRSRILKKWYNHLIDTYPEDTQRFFRKEKDRFSNPVGRTLSQGIETLYDELSTQTNMDNISSCLDKIIRIRAVQDFTPSDAVGFILELKHFVREELKNDLLKNGMSQEMKTLEKTIDKIALLAFDIYVNCRQEIHEIRIKEIKGQVSGLVRRVNAGHKEPDPAPN